MEVEISNDSESEENTNSEEGGYHPSSMLEWKDKWWLNNDKDLKETSDTGYICTIETKKDYDGGTSEYKLFKNITNGYKYVCKYLKGMYNDFGGDNINLYNPSEYYDYPEYENSLADWTNLFFLLNYGSSSGPTYYTIIVSPIIFED